MGIFSWFSEKANPAQRNMAQEEGSRVSSNTLPHTTERAYKNTEIVNRGVNLIIDSAAQVDLIVEDKLKFTALASAKAPGGVRKDKLQEILNVRPNPYMDISSFRRALWMDFVMEGWAFAHWDGTSLYHLPAKRMEVFADTKHYVNKFVYNGDVTYEPSEIVFIKDNSYTSSVGELVGQSRVFSALGSVLKREELQKFKQNFFKNGAIFSLVVETEAVLSKRIKKRFQDEVKLDYNPTTGRSSVLVLDAGAKAKSLTPTSTKDLEVAEDIEILDKNILKALGVPPILMDSGNNANIRPNIDLFYYMTILPSHKKFQSAFELFFGYELKTSIAKVAALAPDNESEAKAVSAKVNNGIITPNEGRKELRYDKSADPAMDKIRIPQNISGSASGVSGQEGGKPTAEESEED